MAKKKKKAVVASAKRRTREHILEDLSVHHITGLVIRCGYTVQKTTADYGYDLWLQTFSDSGEVENDYVQMQVKASESLQRFELKDGVFSFPVQTKDYLTWQNALLPVFLILYDAQFAEAYWLDIQDYAANQTEEVSGEYVRLYIPRTNVLGVQSIRRMRQRKQELAAKMKKNPEENNEQ